MIWLGGLDVGAYPPDLLAPGTGVQIPKPIQIILNKANLSGVSPNATTLSFVAVGNSFKSAEEGNKGTCLVDLEGNLPQEKTKRGGKRKAHGETVETIWEHVGIVGRIPGTTLHFEPWYGSQK